MLFSVVAVVLIAALLPVNILGQNQCNTCQSASQAACHNETAFSVCIKGTPTRDDIICPKDYQCTNGKYICYPKTSKTAACRIVNDGETDPNASSSTTYGTTETFTTSGSTGATDSSQTTFLTSTTNSALTTQKVPRDALTFCQETKKQGSYKSEMDNTCTKYYFCHLDGVTWMGYEVDCPENQWFGENAIYCSSKKPASCI